MQSKSPDYTKLKNVRKIKKDLLDWIVQTKIL